MPSKLRYLAEYAPFYLFAKLSSALPFEVSAKAGRCVGRLFYAFGKRRREMAIKNISTSLGLERGAAEETARRAFENIGITFSEFLKLPSLEESFFEKNIEVEGFENFLSARAEGKGVLLLGAHFGNWELLGATFRRHGGPASVVYRKTKNPYVDSFIDSVRQRCGLKTIPHRNSARKIMSALRHGEAVGILLDQHATSKDGIIVDFFGRPAATNYGLALIALKTGAPVVPTFLIREDGGKFRCVYDKPVHLAKSGDLEADIRDATIRFNEIIERFIRNNPEQWFWIHNRWKV